MKNIIRLLFVMLVMGTVAGCASGQRYDEISAQIPALKAGYGRIYFTRTTEFEALGIQPDIRLNGEVVGSSRPGGFFFVDRPPGDYVVATATEVEKTLPFHLAAGETKYIKTSASLGLLVAHITPTIVFPEQGKSDVKILNYTGPAL